MTRLHQKEPGERRVYVKIFSEYYGKISTSKTVLSLISLQKFYRRTEDDVERGVCIFLIKVSRKIYV
jgi:hypothetical protein